MSDVDVAAIRAAHAVASSRPAEHRYSDAYYAACQVIVDETPALLDALATRDARIDALDRAVFDKCADVAVLRARVAELTAERDNARTALQITLDSARIDRAAAVSTDRLALLRAAIEQLRLVRVDCTALTGPVWYGEGWAAAIHQLEEIADRWPEPKPDAHPSFSRYRVEFHEPADADLPSGGWHPWGGGGETEAEAVAWMRHLREKRPALGPMRIVRIDRTYTVVASESAPPADGPGPHATENGPGRAPDGTEPPPETGETRDAL